MSVFPFPGVATLVGIILILTVRYRYLSKKQKAKEESYYELEKRADQTPAKDLSTLPYIKVPVDSFPFGFSRKFFAFCNTQYNNILALQLLHDALSAHQPTVCIISIPHRAMSPILWTLLQHFIYESPSNLTTSTATLLLQYR